MRARPIAALTGVAAATLALAVTAPAQAQQADGSPSVTGASHRSDNRPGPKSAEQARQRAKALDAAEERHGAAQAARRVAVLPSP